MQRRGFHRQFGRLARCATSALPRTRRGRRPYSVTAGAVALVTGAALLAAAGNDSTEPPAALAASRAESPPASGYFSTVDVASHATVGAPAQGDDKNHGDLWPNCWAGDDNVYTAYGDGLGFDDTVHDIGVAKISGDPGGLRGEQLAEGDQVGKVWNADHTRKPTGMACVDGTLYLAVQDLAMDFNDAPSATVAKSTDLGRTWTFDKGAPMFDGGAFTTVMFLDYGKDYAESPDGYVYAYGLDHNWRDSFNDRVPDPVDLYLARVPKDRVQDRGAWQFVSGTDEAGEPAWSDSIEDREAVLHDDRHVYQDILTPDRQGNMTTLSQGGIVYNKGLDRYLYTSWTEYTFEFYESPTPWGPWKRTDSKDFGGYTWSHGKHGGYGTTIPSKYISADGRSMWLQSNVCPCGGGVPEDDHFAYTYSLRPLRLEPYKKTTPGNGPDPRRNLATEEGTVGVERATHFGETGHYNDGRKTGQSEDDWNDERKTASWWGYTWPRSYSMDKVVYTTGNMHEDGGWFEDLRVQVRKDHAWTDVTGLKVSPSYPGDAGAGPHKTYELSFDTAEGDGVRIIGAPGGAHTFTSIAELEVYLGQQ